MESWKPNFILDSLCHLIIMSLTRCMEDLIVSALKLGLLCHTLECFFCFVFFAVVHDMTMNCNFWKSSFQRGKERLVAWIPTCLPHFPIQAPITVLERSLCLHYMALEKHDKQQ